MGKERVLPTVDQFPTFVDTLSWLTKEACRCIWYLPEKRKYNSLGITPEFNQSALKMARNISKADPLAVMAHKVLAEIAEQSCCGQWHRNDIWGLDLKEKLAARWQSNHYKVVHAGELPPNGHPKPGKDGRRSAIEADKRNRIEYAEQLRGKGYTEREIREAAFNIDEESQDSSAVPSMNEDSIQHESQSQRSTIQAAPEPSSTFRPFPTPILRGLLLIVKLTLHQASSQVSGGPL